MYQDEQWCAVSYKGVLRPVPATLVHSIDLKHETIKPIFLNDLLKVIPFTIEMSMLISPTEMRYNFTYHHTDFRSFCRPYFQQDLTDPRIFPCSCTFYGIKVWRDSNQRTLHWTLPLLVATLSGNETSDVMVKTAGTSALVLCAARDHTGGGEGFVEMRHFSSKNKATPGYRKPCISNTFPRKGARESVILFRGIESKRTITAEGEPPLNHSLPRKWLS